MKRIVFFMMMLLGIQNLSALSNYAEVYPPIMQAIIDSAFFRGDIHGEFVGDDVTILSDGSAWKVHPDSIATYRSWNLGDIVHIAVRTDWYWFKREHKFLLYNHNRAESIKVMLAQHKMIPLKIVSTDTYYKSQRAVFIPQTVYTTDVHGNNVSETHTQFSHYEPSNPRKVIALSDGSVWVIKDNLNEFQLGMNVYVGAQGQPEKFYDFVMISGKEREAEWTLARPQK